MAVKQNATKDKKIWFAEYVFPSMNSCTNESNMLLIKQHREQILRYSNGEVSFLAQKIAIEGTLRKLQNSEMVKKIFFWASDARSFHYFLNLYDM
ncbi:MAG: hypothetical protein ACR5K2_01140 [Wolbachia sp.]